MGQHFPGGTKDKKMPANAGDMRWIPGLEGLIPHAAKQLSPCTTTTEPTFWGLRAATAEACAPQREATATRSPCTTRSRPRSLQPQKACMQQRGPRAAQNNEKK